MKPRRRRKTRLPGTERGNERPERACDSGNLKDKVLRMDFEGGKKEGNTKSNPSDW